MIGRKRSQRTDWSYAHVKKLISKNPLKIDFVMSKADFFGVFFTSDVTLSFIKKLLSI
jgi:hypothetical protein